MLITAFAPTLFFFTPLFAFLGGVAAFVLVYSLSWKGGLSPLRIILVGVAVNAMFTGLSSGLNSMNGGDMSGVAAIVNGNITMKTWDDVRTLVPYVIVGLVLALIFTGMCNLLSLEDKTARSLGVNVNLMRIIISMIAVLLASISTAVAGVISFLGLIVPHIGRLLVGSDHRALVPFSALFGAFLFLLADTIGRTIAAPYEVSASIIMSVVGGPFFIILLRRSKEICKIKPEKDKWSDKPAMEVRDLHFAYGRNKVLKGVSLKIEEGKITTIMGANGCGKSTLFSLMTKNLYPRKGNIFLKGKNIQNLNLKEFARKVAIVQQYNSASDDITVENLVAFGRTPHKKGDAGRQCRR